MRHLILVTRPTSSHIGLAILMISIFTLGAWSDTKADEFIPSSTPDFPAVIRAHSNQLAQIESDKGAGNLFVSTIGPALQMGDVARTLGANPLPTKLANELLVPDLRTAVHRLMGSLAAGSMATTVRQAVKEQRLSAVSEKVSGSPLKSWLYQQENAPWHDSLIQLSDLVASPEWAKGNQDGSLSTPMLLVTLLERAAGLELEAMQGSYQEWDRIRNWKDRVRGLRGQARLCGTWQWIIHNHQHNHREQKLSLLFPATGNLQAAMPELAEMVVVGENVYLRWEVDGRVQEDSLQFSKEGQRLEGTFVNSQGGWGSISGKRIAGCVP